MTEKISNSDKIILAIITIATVIAAWYGFSRIPSPAAQKDRNFDNQRVLELYDIKTGVEYYYQNNSYLPQSLNQITTISSYSTTPLIKTDPQTKQQYEYKTVDTVNYQLCATFVTDTLKPADPGSSTVDLTDYTSSSTYTDFKHPQGYHCFNLTIPSYTLKSTPTPTWPVVSETPAVSPTGRVGSPTPYPYATNPQTYPPYQRQQK